MGRASLAMNGEYVRVREVAEVVVCERIMGFPGKIVDACGMQFCEALNELSVPADTAVDRVEIDRES
jgi:hypothetical protein